MVTGEMIVIVDYQQSMSSITKGLLIFWVKMVAVEHKP